MQSAIDRMVKAGVMGNTASILQNPRQPTICSVPLLEMHVDRPDRFSMRTAPPPATDDRMPGTRGPAPACEQTGRCKQFVAQPLERG